jgi:hypothetical protein
MAARAAIVRRAAIAIALLAPAVAAAGEAEKTQAELVFQKAVQKLAAGAAADACALFEESDKLDPQPGTEYELAKCYATIGRHASAWSRFRAVAEKLDARGEHEKAEKIRRLVEATIEPKLARLTITVRSPQAGDLDVRRDGVPIGKAMWGTATPVDPGAHRVRVFAKGKRPWEASVDVANGASVTVEVPDLVDELASPPPPPPKVAPLPVAPPPPSPRPPLPWPATRKAAIAVGALGVVGLAVGAGLGAAAFNRAAEWQRLVDQHCNNPARDCESTEQVHTIQGVERDRSTFATGSTIAFVAGGVALAGGLTLWLVAPRERREATTNVGVVPWASKGAAGLVVGGGF